MHFSDLEVCCDWSTFFSAQVSRRSWGRNAWRTLRKSAWEASFNTEQLWIKIAPLLTRRRSITVLKEHALNMMILDDKVLRLWSEEVFLSREISWTLPLIMCGWRSIFLRPLYCQERFEKGRLYLYGTVNKTSDQQWSPLNYPRRTLEMRARRTKHRRSTGVCLFGKGG